MAERVAGRPAPTYAADRAALLARLGSSGPGRRQALARLTDTWLAGLLTAATDDLTGIAVVAVGGYGLRQLSPGSDLDLLLLHDGRADVAEVADRIWYPVWDAGVRLDHSVRRPEEARRLAERDLPVLLGLLDARLVAGDGRLVDRMRGDVLYDWRRNARTRLPELHQSCREREERCGAVAYTVEPDLKDGAGGLRDVTCLRAVAASWIADRPHGDVDGARDRLLDVRDALHLVTGRPGDRLLLQEQDAVATRLGLADADSVLRIVAEAARTVDYAADVTWRRVERVVSSRRKGLRVLRPPRLRRLGPGLLEHEGEVVVALDAAVSADPVLPLRAAATAAENGLFLSPDAVERLTAAPALPDPWPDEARHLLVSLLGAGPALVPVWEAMDQADLISRMIPEWGLVRSRPQRNAVHRWTVDRHLVETAARAAALTRGVSRPDLLLVAALLHDLGKGRRRGDHSREGERLTRTVAARMGFDSDDVEVLARLVLHHLVLADTATRRDLEEPATAAAVATAVGSIETLQLLHALTEADAAATGPAVWSDWRAELVDTLVRRTARQLRGEPVETTRPSMPDQHIRLLDAVATAEDPAGRVRVELKRDGSTWVVTIAAPDQRGLIAAAAGVLALHRLAVRSANMRTECESPGQRGIALDVWRVEPEHGAVADAERIRDDLRRALDGRLDVAGLLDRRDASRPRQRVPVAAPKVVVDSGASDSATVLEVRAHDRLGLLHRLGRALALAGLDVRAARVATLGAEVVDVFYVVDERRRRLTDERARETARILRDVAT